MEHVVALYARHSFVINELIDLALLFQVIDVTLHADVELFRFVKVELHELIRGNAWLAELDLFDALVPSSCLL